MKRMRKVRLLVRSAAMTNAYNAYFSIIVAKSRKGRANRLLVSAINWRSRQV
jgi:hypothetical protein